MVPEFKVDQIVRVVPALSCCSLPITPHDIPVLKEAKAEYAKLQ
jgi:hypothetical protein